TMFTLALVRFPPTATKEIQYLNAKGALTYTDIAGDPVLYGNLPPREISMKDVFRSGDSSKKFKIAEGQWYRYAPSYVSPAYRSEERFSRNAETDLVCRLLLEKKNCDVVGCAYCDVCFLVGYRLPPAAFGPRDLPHVYALMSGVSGTARPPAVPRPLMSLLTRG